MAMILFLFLFLGVPLILTVYNIVVLFNPVKEIRLRNFIWFLTAVLGVLFTVVLFDVSEIAILHSWDEQLYNNQLHQPIWSGGALTITVVSLLGCIGAIILGANNVNKLPPLLSVLCISAIYLTIGMLIIWAIQCERLIDGISVYYLLVPFNGIIIGINIIKDKINEWNSNEEHSEDNYGKNKIIKKLNIALKNANAWPYYAVLFMIPLLGIVLLVLILFGQQPDAIIKAWTETSDWTFSTKESPQNIYYDEHYLCTAAAGGHRRIVKPIRKGIRHGHPVIVNRQLLIANAFENILEEHTPRFHKCVRQFYDKHGFPIADMIRTNKIACDITYFVMKPLEWIFLVVLYLVDVKPENRIAVQYFPKEIIK